MVWPGFHTACHRWIGSEVLLYGTSARVLDRGTPLDDPQRGAEIFSTLASAASAQLTVVRNGRPTDVNLNLADMARQVEEISSGQAPGAAGPNQPPSPGQRPPESL